VTNNIEGLLVGAGVSTYSVYQPFWGLSQAWGISKMLIVSNTPTGALTQQASLFLD
jgi:hypothetical protein